MYRVHVVFMFALIQKMGTMKQFSLGSCAVRGIDEVKAKNVLSFGQQSHKRTQTRYFLFTTYSEKCQNITMASLTYVCFIPAKGLIRGLSTNLSNIAFEVALASK